VVGAKSVAEGQREKHAEWRTTVHLSVEQAGEEHWFRCRLSPPDCLAGTDQPGKIERFGRYGDRGFHAPLSDAISEEIETRGASSGHSSVLPRPLSKVENPAFRAGLRGWLGDRVGRDAGMF
jgi:hypothetical protein